jgi:hypothetical protein
MTQEVHLRGEYWIQDGHVEFADGDVGDRNHEGIATDSVFSQYESEIAQLAEDHQVELENKYGEYHSEDLSAALDQIKDAMTEKGMSGQQADAEIIKFLGCNNEAYAILCGGGDARLYAMKYENWIAVRGNNIELYGYDESKRNHLHSGVSEILDQEGIDEDVPPEDVEFTMYDHKTKRSTYLTYQDMEQPTTAFRPTQNLMSVKKVSGYKSNKDTDENLGQNPSPSVKNKWTAAAQKAGVIAPGHDLWRGTSEGMSFSRWLSIQESQTNGGI